MNGFVQSPLTTSAEEPFCCTSCGRNPRSILVRGTRGSESTYEGEGVVVGGEEHVASLHVVHVLEDEAGE
eukprot:746434-Hanusia_phi.AAC.3